MSPRTDRPLVRLAAILSWTLTASAAAQGQTIADYSRAQRAVLENAMVQSAARSAGLAASAPAIAAAPGPVPPPMPLMPPPTTRNAPELAPASPRVSGIFASAAGVVAEVDVNGTPYLLSAGQPVPGTGWRVESVAVERVVLGRFEPSGSGRATEASRRVFSLPPLH